jgi:hypothetical protein
MSKSDSERGSTLVTVAVTLVVLFAFLALAVDIGAAYVERRRVQAVADAAALAGVQVLSDNGSDAEIQAVINEYVLGRNPLAGYELRREHTSQWLEGTRTRGDVGNGARPVGVTGVLVTVRGYVPTSFANYFGISELSAVAPGGSGYSPLDVVLVLDRSGSMDDDSCTLHHSLSGFNLRDFIIGGGHCDTGAMEVTSSNCMSCGCQWSDGIGPCRWPDGTRMSPAPAVCGTVDTRETCEACKGVWPGPSDPEQLLPIADTKTAAKTFVDLVEQQLMPTSPQLGLATYSRNAELDQPLTYNFLSLKSRIDSMVAESYTNCEHGLYLARQELTTVGRSTASKAILFMSDGVCNRSMDWNPPCNSGSAPAQAICEAGLAKDQGINLYTIGLGTGADQDTLRAIASSSDNYLYAPSSADLEAVFTEMFEKIKRQRLVK